MSKQIQLDLPNIPGMGKHLLWHLSQQNHSTNDNIQRNYFSKQIELKSSFGNRSALTDALKNQYKNTNVGELTKANIELLSKETSFCITTGHQLSLVGGPLFVTYKILTTIWYCRQLKSSFPEKDFIPVFWMASEDHDKDEINKFIFNKQTYQWNTGQTGAVGRFDTKGIHELLSQFESEHPLHNGTVLEIAKKAYHEKTLANATRFFINELFGQYGLVIIDGDDKNLKQSITPIVEKEIREKITFKNVQLTNEKIIGRGFEPVIAPRELNLFLLTPNDRKRLIFENNKICSIDHEFSWSETEFLEYVKNHPDEISPNVLLRPVYQETILPNLAYIGGPTETEYWLQLDDLFNALNIPMPLRLMRFTNGILNEKQLEQIHSSGIPSELLYAEDHLIGNFFIAKNSTADLDFTNETTAINNSFESIAKKASISDVTLVQSVHAEKAKQIKSLEGLFARIKKAEKQKQEVEINRILKIKSSLIPQPKTLQERVDTLFNIKKTPIEFFDQVLMNSIPDKHNILSA